MAGTGEIDAALIPDQIPVLRNTLLRLRNLCGVHTLHTHLSLTNGYLKCPVSYLESKMENSTEEYKIMLVV